MPTKNRQQTEGQASGDSTSWRNLFKSQDEFNDYVLSQLGMMQQHSTSIEEFFFSLSQLLEDKKIISILELGAQAGKQNDPEYRRARAARNIETAKEEIQRRNQVRAPRR